MASIRIKRKGTNSTYGTGTTLLPGELAVAGKWLWYGPKDTDIGDDSQIQARPVYSPTTIGGKGSILISTGDDLNWLALGTPGYLLTATENGVQWAAAPKTYDLELNGNAIGSAKASWYAPISGGNAGQYLVSNGSTAPTWKDFPVKITLNGAITETPSFFAPTGSGEDGQMLYSSGSGKAPVWKAAPTFTDTNQKIKAYATTSEGQREYVTFGDNDVVTIMSGSDNVKITASSSVGNISIWGPDVYNEQTNSGTGYYSVSYINSMFNTLAGQNEFIGVYKENDLTSANIQSKLNAFVLSEKSRNPRNGDLINISNTTVYNGEQWRYDGSTNSWAYYIDWKDTTLDKATSTTLGGVKIYSDTAYTGTPFSINSTSNHYRVELDADGKMSVGVYGFLTKPGASSSATSYNLMGVNSSASEITLKSTADIIASAIVMRKSDSQISVPLNPTADTDAVSKSYVDKKMCVYIDEILLAG